MGSIGFFMGSMLSSILLSIIKSSVDAVIVCFAGSPVELESYHKELAHELRSEWKIVWPGSVDFVFDTSVPVSIHLPDTLAVTL
jgi:tRNA A37 threonylcarbamoyladenosine synthetase subunit TsaC/SUA5/YrdC